MKAPHPHAAAMLLYAEDAADTDAPWERWEFKCSDNGFNTCLKHPEWNDHFEYRRKPQTITVNGVEVPEPMRKEPKKTQHYYLAYPISKNMYAQFDWAGTKADKLWFEKGLIHHTREAAIAHTKALLLPSQRNRSEY